MASFLLSLIAPLKASDLRQDYVDQNSRNITNLKKCISTTRDWANNGYNVQGHVDTGDSRMFYFIQNDNIFEVTFDCKYSGLGQPSTERMGKLGSVFKRIPGSGDNPVYQYLFENGNLCEYKKSYREAQLEKYCYQKINGFTES